MLSEVLIGFATSVAGGLVAYWVVRHFRRKRLARAARKSGNPESPSPT